MALPPPKLLITHAVVQTSTPLPRDPGQDERFIEAVREQFPNVLARQYLGVDANPQIPHLTLASTSSQLALSAVQADFEVRFYGDLVEDVNLALEYVSTKLHSILGGFEAIGAAPAMVGLIGTVHFDLTDVDLDPVAHVLSTHLRCDVDPDQVQDAQAKVTVRVRDKYFVNLTVNNYVLKIFQRPVMPNMGVVQIRPWEGNVSETGLELTVDINNNLEAQEMRANPVLTSQGINEVARLLREVTTTTGPEFVEHGRVSTDSLATSEI